MTAHLIFALAVASGFYMAWNIGSNDVANAMGTSVGAGTLKLKKAAFIAGIMNFLGALLVGTHVTNTVRKGVINPGYFTDTPEKLIIGMLSVVVSAGIWVTFATWKQWPVSTTHSVIGAVIGFGISAGGVAIIKWKIVVLIVLSWVISPVFGGLISYLTFYAIRKFILSRVNPFEAARKSGGYFVGTAAFFLVLAMLFKGLKNLHLNLSLPVSSLIALGISVLLGLITHRILKKIKPARENPYDSVEELAKPLQIVSAAYESFANGANDVANAIGPVAAIIAVLESGSVSMQAPVPLWLLALGGFGIWVGISTWGWRVMATIGRNITHITPTRGFAAEFGTATTVLICSQLGMPVSTTHTSVGNVIGVGLAKGMEAINYRVVWKIVEGWLWTLPIAALASALIYRLLTALLLPLF